MNPIIGPIALPIAAGLLAFCAPRVLGRAVRWFAVVVAAATFGFCLRLYLGAKPLAWTVGAGSDAVELLRMDGLGALVLAGIGLFALLMTLYSVGFFARGAVSERLFYGSVLLSLGAACGVALASHALLFVMFWGLLSVPLFLLIQRGSDQSNAAAKKAMLVVGGTDSLLVLGLVAFVIAAGGAEKTSSWSMFPPSPMPVTTAAAWVSVLCFLVAALAKAGAMPFHTWVPDACEAAPVPAVALLPASLDKLLGIYLLSRVFLTLFQIPEPLQLACLLIGAGTIIFAVMAAMVQHNLRRLLGFHAVSQVGYMVVGIATMTPVGVVGGLFHMLNHAIYKSCLFLTAGAAEKKTGETELDKMGGLARTMPVTFLAALTAAFAISGIPPLNGFASKWMVYNGIIASQHLGFVWVIVLTAAMFGSALTLASFVKVLHSVFLGQPKKPQREGQSPSFLMVLPMVVLALLCLILGVFAVRVGVHGLISPATPYTALEIPGLWSSGIATLLLVLALLVGLVIYLVSTFTRKREDEAYVGGEIGSRAADYNYEGVEFYKTIGELSGLRALYEKAEARWFDLYEQSRRFVFYVTGFLRQLHDGVLYTYVTWSVLGLVLLLWWLLYAYKVVGRAF